MNRLLALLMMPFRSLDLSKRFVLLIASMVMLTVFSAQWFYSRQSRTYLELRLQEKAAFVNKFYSYVISGLLMRKDDIGLQQVINTLEEDSEVSSVIVVDQKNRVRYHVDAQKVGTILDDPLMKSVLGSGEHLETPFRNSGGQALALVSPLKTPGGDQLLGAVRVDLTYHTIERQMASSGGRFWFITIGSVVSCAGMLLTFLSMWILIPLQRMRGALETVNPSQPQLDLPESADEIGQLQAAAKMMVERFKNELHQERSHHGQRQEQEKAWVVQLASSFLPDARILVADKDNRIISDTGNGARPPAGRRHLLDLIQDANFATLLASAFQREGEVMRGPVTFQEKSYQASILSVPAQQAAVVKTLIALQPH